MVSSHRTLELQTLAAEYVRLQNAVVRALRASAGGELSQDPSEWPQRGTLVVEGSTWTFRRHGLGYTFSKEGRSCVVEAHEHIDAEPFPFDAFRLQEYLRALGGPKVTLDGREYEPELFAIQGALEELVLRGVLRHDVRSEGSPVKAYVLEWS